MTQIQKVIKYIAVSFAILLIITITSGILTAAYLFLDTFGLINKNNDVITSELKTINKDINEISTLNIDLAYTNLYIKTGSEFEIKTNNKNIKYEENNNSINIKEKNKVVLSTKNIESKLIIYIPTDINIIDEVNIDVGAGKINIEELNVNDLYFDLGAGEVHIKDVIAKNKSTIDGGVGKTELINCELNNLKANLGIGEFTYNGILYGNSYIDSGIGRTSLNLKNTKESYTIKASKGIGSINIDSEEIKSDVLYGSGVNYLELDGGIGEIKINFLN